MFDAISAAGPKFNWTDEVVVRLRQLYQQGLSATQIGIRLGTSRNAVIGKLHRLGLMRGHAPAKPRPTRLKPDRETRLTAIALPGRPAPIRLSEFSMGGHQKKMLNARIGNAIKALPIEPPPQPRGDKPGLMQLGMRDCRWPYGDPRHPDFHFCGATVPGASVEDTPYCAAHAREAVAPIQPRITRKRAA